MIPLFIVLLIAVAASSFAVFGAFTPATGVDKPIESKVTEHRTQFELSSTALVDGLRFALAPFGAKCIVAEPFIASQSGTETFLSVRFS